MSATIARTSPFKLRPYQADVVQSVHQQLKTDQRVLVVAGTGAGKNRHRIPSYPGLSYSA